MLIVTPLFWVTGYIQLHHNHNPGGWWLVGFGTLVFVACLWDLIRDR